MSLGNKIVLVCENFKQLVMSNLAIVIFLYLSRVIAIYNTMVAKS